LRPILTRFVPSFRRVRVAMLALATVGSLVSGSVLASPSYAAGGRVVHLTAFEHRLLKLMNDDRTARGLRPLTVAACAEDFARQWTQTMARRDLLQHNPALKKLWSRGMCRNASKLAENIGVAGTNPDALYKAYMASPGHRANILNPRLRYVGIGSWQLRDGLVFNTVDFSNGASPAYVTVKHLGQGLRTP
jgi:uncharacterized protein YkwD